jgi:hypothetical protein
MFRYRERNFVVDCARSSQGTRFEIGGLGKKMYIIQSGQSGLSEGLYEVYLFTLAQAALSELAAT